MAVMEHPGTVTGKMRSEGPGRDYRQGRAAPLDIPVHQRIMDEIDLRRMGRTLWRWRVLVATVTLLAAIISVVVVKSLTPIYTATTQIAVGQPSAPLFKLEQVVADLKGDNESIATEIGIIRSRKLAQKTVLKLGLDTMPEFDESPGLLHRLSAALNPHRLLPSVFGPVQSTVLNEEDNADRKLNSVVDTFLDRLKVSNDAKSRIVTLSFESPSAERAALIVNTAADFYITSQLDAKLEATKRASLWLSDQISQLQQSVLTSDAAVEQFRRDHGLVRSEAATLTSQEMTQVAAEAMTAHTKRLEAESHLVQVQHSSLARGRSGDPNALPEVLQSPLIQTLRGQESDASRRLADLQSHYGDKYPAVINTRAELDDVRSRIQTEVAKITEGLRNEAANAQVQENSLNALLEKVKAEQSRSNIDEVQLHELERESQANKTLYESLLQRLKETQSQENYQQADAQIISSAATPNLPSFPQEPVLIILSTITGLFLGAILALVCENLDVGLRSMEQVKENLNLNPLGMIPTVAGDKGRKAQREILDRPLSSYSEALRTLQANIFLSDIDCRPKTILITSSLPGEGKSTVTLSLAHMMARDGLRVLLIDCDLRRPTQHDLTGLSAGPGLADWLVDKSQFEEIVQVQKDSGVHVITAGKLPSVPPNLLGSMRFQQMLKHVREHYDVILLDSAPVLAIADTRVLASIADKTVFITKWAETSRKVAAASIEQLHRAGADIAGAVLTLVDIKSHARDGFSDSVLYSGRLKHYYR